MLSCTSYRKPNAKGENGKKKKKTYFFLNYPPS